jgi:hypothetical protein
MDERWAWSNMAIQSIFGEIEQQQKVHHPPPPKKRAHEESSKKKRVHEKRARKRIDKRTETDLRAQVGLKSIARAVLNLPGSCCP